MKKLLPLFLIAFVLTACAPATAQFVQLPDAERLGITTLIVAVVGLIFGKIAQYIPWTQPFLTKYKEEISVSLAAAVVGFIENALPSAYPEISILVVQLLLAALAAVGLFRVFAKVGVYKFKAG